MKQHKMILLSATLGLGVAFGGTAMANEAEHGAAPAGPVDITAKVGMCEACHGAGGNKPVIPAYPVIGGQYANYLEHALLDYKSGARKNPIMLAQVATLSAAEIKALARHFGDQQGPLYTPTLP